MRYGDGRKRQEPRIMHGFLEIPFAENRALEDREAYGGQGGRQEGKAQGHQMCCENIQEAI